MVEIIALAALVILAVLALRFGADSRPALESHEHTLARFGVTWDGVRLPAEPTVRILTVPASGEPYPTLRAIDAARDDVSPLAADPNAAELELRARELTTEYWSEHVWMTGLVPHRAFERVAAALEQARAVPQDNLTVIVMRETASLRTPIAM
jgi:hypothetical protein